MQWGRDTRRRAGLHILAPLVLAAALVVGGAGPGLAHATPCSNPQAGDTCRKASAKHEQKHGTPADEHELEQSAAIGLLVLIALLGIGLVVLSRRMQKRGRISSHPARNWDDAPVPYPNPEDMPSPKNALELGRLLESSNEWVHRRVESVEFLDVKTIRRRVSVDFSLPASKQGPRLERVPNRAAAQERVDQV